MGKMKSKNIILIGFLLLLQACSTADDSIRVISTQDLTTQTTLVTVTTIKDEVVDAEISAEDAEISAEDAELVLARCLRGKGYDVDDPKNDEGLRTILTPIFISFNERQRQELFQNIQLCAEENGIPLEGNSNFENPEDVADRLDTELEFAQCLRGKGIEVSDPTAEKPLRPILFELVQSQQYTGDQIREAAGECFDDLGIEPPSDR